MRYAFIDNCKHGLVDITTVRRISFNEANQRLMSGGDTDRFPTSQFKGYGDVTGTIELEDPQQAQALLEAPAATLVFEGQAETGANNKVTALNVIFFSRSGTDGHNAIASRTLNWGAKSADGQTSPIDESPVAA